MAIVRTAKGANASKASGTSLSVNNVQCDAGTTIVVGIAFDPAQGNPEIKWGKKSLSRDITIENAGADLRCQIYSAKVRRDRTLDVVATWAAAIEPRAMFVTQISEAGIEDVSKDKAEDATTDPDTGVAPTTTVADTMCIAALASKGPDTDSYGTIGSGHSAGQRVGTSGGGDTTNITIFETYELLSTITTVKSQLTGATSRDWACCIVAFKSMDTYTVDTSHYEPYDGYPEMESVVFTMKDGAGDRKFQVHIPREEFEEMTDVQVEERIQAECSWWADKLYRDVPSPDFTPDSTFNTRVASFTNDTFKV